MTARKRYGLVARVEPDVALMELRMPGTDGVRRPPVTTSHPRVRVLVLRTYDGEADILRSGGAPCCAASERRSRVSPRLGGVARDHGVLAFAAS